MLRTADLEYDLPESLIATTPAEPRDSAKLLVATRDGTIVEHARVRDLPRFLRRDDLLVVNATRVLPARLEGVRTDTGGAASGLFLEATTGRRWVVLVKARRQRTGVAIALHARDGSASGVSLRLLERSTDEQGAWIAAVEADPRLAGMSDEALLSLVGRTPLPPYIVRARERAGVAAPEERDRERYQTVYARADRAGSVAAPTAGLHLTPELLDVLSAMGVSRAEVVLHVGTGTFRQVEAEFLERHEMHAEWCSMESATGARLAAARAAPHETLRGRVVCVGTTSARTVESYATASAGEWPSSLSTRLLIAPGYRWRWTDGLLTNFHLPRSTLLAMVASLFEPGDGSEGIGLSRLKRIYGEAVRLGYRFFSYGDAMLVLP